MKASINLAKNERTNSDNRPNPSVLLIPGIGIPYSEVVKIIKNEPIFKEYSRLAKIKSYIGKDIDGGAEVNNENSGQDSLASQKLAYITNCTMTDIYFKNGIHPYYIVGYSMGLYAALYGGGYYSFKTGLRILEKAYQLSNQCCQSLPINFIMGIILGLKRKELEELVLNGLKEYVKIAVFNGVRSFVIAGKKEEVYICLKKATLAGAFTSKPIFTEIPYHTIFLKDIEFNFRRFLGGIDFTIPAIPVISLVNNQPILRKNIVEAIVNHMFSTLYFDKTIQGLYKNHQIRTAYETGPDQAMRRLTRYVNKRIKVYSLFKEE